MISVIHQEDGSPRADRRSSLPGSLLLDDCPSPWYHPRGWRQGNKHTITRQLKTNSYIPVSAAEPWDSMHLKSPMNRSTHNGAVTWWQRVTGYWEKCKMQSRLRNSTSSPAHASLQIHDRRLEETLCPGAAELVAELTCEANWRRESANNVDISLSAASRMFWQWLSES